MREVLLLRHAEAAPTTAGGRDAERPLTAHGEQQARAIGDWMAAQGLRADSVLCSSARRARMTAALALAPVTQPPPVTRLDAIYAATPGELLALLNRHGTGERVLLVGHNPGLQDLVTTLCGALPTYRGMPPATLARIALDDAAAAGRGRVVAWHTA